jgi:hypothetical protein
MIIRQMCSTSIDLFWKEVQTNEKIAVAQAEYQHKQTFIELKNEFENVRYLFVLCFLIPVY